MKKLFYSTTSALLGAAFLFSPISALAEDYTPLSINVGGTGGTTLEEAKENLEIPNVIDSASGDSTTDTMSQRAIKECISAGSGGGIITTGDPGSSTSLVIHQKGVTDHFISKDDVVHNAQGSSMTKVVSQKGLKDSITDALSTIPQLTIENSTGQNTDRVMSQKAVSDALSTIVQDSIVSSTGNSTTKIMSQKAVTDAILTTDTINAIIQSAITQTLSTVPNFNSIYPVGSIYMSVSPINPGTLFGGTWNSWGSGCVPVGINTGDADFNAVEKTGGVKTVALTETQIPAHQHSVYTEYGTNVNLTHNPTSQNYMQLAGTSAGTRSVQSSPLVKGGGSGTPIFRKSTHTTPMLVMAK